jgi:hypothetical protein
MDSQVIDVLMTKHSEVEYSEPVAIGRTGARQA